MLPSIGQQTQRVLLARHPQDARRWLEELPQQVEQLFKQWECVWTGETLGEGHGAYILPVRIKETEAVLRLSIDAQEFRRIVAGLQCFSESDHSVQLLDFDASKNAMLLERLRPGIPYQPSKDPRCPETLASIHASLHRSAANYLPRIEEKVSFSTAEQRLARWQQESRSFWDSLTQLNFPLPAKEEGEKIWRLADQLLISQGERVLTHGDLHYLNLLQHKDRLVAIDPAPCLAEPEMALANSALTCNWGEELPQRMAKIAKVAGLSEERTISYGRVNALWFALLRLYYQVELDGSWPKALCFALPELGEKEIALIERQSELRAKLH
jgi:streptomycin 6-kinase